MNDALILAFNIDDAAFEKLEHLCGALGLAVRRVPKAAFSLPLGALLGMPAARLTNAPNAGDFDDPMLVMCNLEEEPFNLFLQGLRFSGIPRIDLKAVLTPVNIAWNAVQLRDELSREHAQVQAQARRQGPQEPQP